MAICIEAVYHEVYKSYNSVLVAHLSMTGTVMINHAETLMNDHNNIMSILSYCRKLYNIIAPSEAIIMSRGGGCSMQIFNSVIIFNLPWQLSYTGYLCTQCQ